MPQSYGTFLFDMPHFIKLFSGSFLESEYSFILDHSGYVHESRYDMNRKKFGFAIVGTGAIASVHAKAIEAIDNAVLLGVYSQTKEKKSRFAAEHDCAAYDALEELLALKEIDIVCICTPSGIHLEPALKCIEAGKHCLIEKPLEVNLERCDRIINAAKDRGVLIGVVFPSRFYPESKKLKGALNADWFGKIVVVSADVKWRREPDYYKSAAWRGTWKLDGGGALMNQGIHSVDMLQWLAGPVDSVQAAAANILHKNIEVEDTLAATIKFKSGALGTIECSTAVYPGALKRLEIMGTSGTAVMEDNDIVKWEFQNQKTKDTKIKNPSGFDFRGFGQGGVSDPMSISFYGHQKQIEELMDAIEAGSRPLVDGMEGRKSVEIVCAIYESARTGTCIKLT